jgi:hypothetical protein
VENGAANSRPLHPVPCLKARPRAPR